MSLYEALDSFVGAGVLACAGAVGTEMPAGIALDGSAFSRFLREQHESVEFGAVLDVLGREVWLAEERLGFPQSLCEANAVLLARLLSDVRVSSEDLAAALDQATRALTAVALSAVPATPLRQRLAASFIERARTAGGLERSGLAEEAALFLLEQLFHYLIEQPRVLLALKPALTRYRAQLLEGIAPALGTASERAADDGRNGSAAGAALVPAAPQPVPTSVAEIRARHKLPEGALQRFEAILATREMTGPQRLSRLDELAAWLASTVAQLSRPSNEPADLRRLKSEAAAALALGEFERAVELLKQVRGHLRDERRRIEARLASELQDLKVQMAEEAAAVARLGEVAFARMDFAVAAELFAEAATSVPASERGLELRYRLLEAEAQSAAAEASGELPSIAAAASAWRRAAALTSREADPAGWVRIHVGLADMLAAEGSRERAATRALQEAVEAYDIALGAIDPSGDRVRWATLQLSRALVLVELGERGDKRRHWLAAAAALMPALESFEAAGDADYAELTRSTLRRLHESRTQLLSA